MVFDRIRDIMMEQLIIEESEIGKDTSFEEL